MKDFNPDDHKLVREDVPVMSSFSKTRPVWKCTCGTQYSGGSATGIQRTHNTHVSRMRNRHEAISVKAEAHRLAELAKRPVNRQGRALQTRRKR